MESDHFSNYYLISIYNLWPLSAEHAAISESHRNGKHSHLTEAQQDLGEPGLGSTRRGTVPRGDL